MEKPFIPNINKSKDPTKEIEYWAIKYEDENNLYKSGILQEAQIHLNQKDFSELLLILINSNQRKYENLTISSKNTGKNF